MMMLEVDILFDLFIIDFTFVTSTSKNSEGCLTTSFDSNWAYSWAWVGLTNDVGSLQEFICPN